MQTTLYVICDTCSFKEPISEDQGSLDGDFWPCRLCEDGTVVVMRKDQAPTTPDDDSHY